MPCLRNMPGLSSLAARALYVRGRNTAPEINDPCAVVPDSKRGPGTRLPLDGEFECLPNRSECRFDQSVDQWLPRRSQLMTWSKGRRPLGNGVLAGKRIASGPLG